MHNVQPLISVQKIGGFAGLSFNFEQQIAELTEDQQARLDWLIAACGLRESAKISNKSKNARDVFAYSFILREGDVTYSASFDDTTLTPAYRELFQYVQGLSRDH